MFEESWQTITSIVVPQMLFYQESEAVYYQGSVATGTKSAVVVKQVWSLAITSIHLIRINTALWQNGFDYGRCIGIRT